MPERFAGTSAAAAGTWQLSDHNVTPQQVRLAWTLHHSPNILAIPGTGNPSHLEENIAAGSLRLSPEGLATLD